MKKSFYVSFCTLLITGILFIIIFCSVMYYPVNLPLELIAVKNTDMTIFTHWKTVCDNCDPLLDKLSECGVTVPEVDFQKNNLIISQGKEISSISYKRVSCLQNSINQKTYLGKTQYGDFNKNNVYFYITKKINVIYDIFKDPI